MGLGCAERGVRRHARRQARGAMTAGLGQRAAGGVGVSVPRIDGVPKVTGTFAYASDLWMDGMLWAATLRSPHAHAAIRNIDISEALASPGVAAVLVAGDIPGANRFGLNFTDQPVLADTVVRYAGEPIALAAAQTPELARRAISRIAAEFEPLPVLADMQEALRAGAPRLHEFGNVLRHVHLRHGDPDGAARS